MPTLKLRNLLWSTRGKEWGFRFVHVPPNHSGQWDAVYHGIFDSDDQVPQRWQGVATLPDGEVIEYVASRFFDQGEHWEDSSGREVPHEMLLPVEGISPNQVALTAWELSVMDQVRARYRDAYSRDFHSIDFFLMGATEEVAIPVATLPPRAMRRDIDLASPESQRLNSARHRTRDRFPSYQSLKQKLCRSGCDAIAMIRNFLTRTG